MTSWDTTIVEVGGRFWWNTWCEVRGIELTGWSATRDDAVRAVGTAIDEACAPTSIQRDEPPKIKDSGTPMEDQMT